MEKMKTCWLLLSVMLSCCEAYKYLVVYPIPARSHANLGDGVVRNLLKAGHEVVYITPYAYKPSQANLRQIDVSSNSDIVPPSLLNIDSIMSGEARVEEHSLMIHVLTQTIKQTVENENVQKLLNDPNEKFDAVIAEWIFSDLPAGFAAVFDCPLIWVSSLEPHWMLLDEIDQLPNPSFTVDIMSLYTPPLTFVQRVKELWTQIKVKLILYMFIDPAQNEEYERLFGSIVQKRGRQLPSFYDIRYNASLVLGNSHVAMGQANTLPLCYKSIGGYHIDDEGKPPLTEDLKKIMDNAKNGVIYFSMGSNLKSKDLPDEIKKNILKMFGTLKQVVLWKFEEVLPDLPPNVHIIKWAPQAAILSHPNCVLFITHGGLLSTTEAIHYGVPIVGIPVFVDQFANVVRAMSKGFATKVDLSYTMDVSLKAAIEEVITNPRYTEKAKELSFIYHDRPIKPGAELVHWVQHVVRTRGALHLRSPALHVPFYQKMYLDLAALIVILAFAALIALRRLCSIVCPKSKTSRKKKNN